MFKKKWMFVIILLLISAFAFKGTNQNCFSVNVHAASAKKKALKAYKKMLSKKKLRINVEGANTVRTSKLSFAVAYIDNNSVPELILKRTDDDEIGFNCHDLFYIYRKGKTKRLTASYGNVSMTGYYYKKTGFFEVYEDGDDFYLKLENGKLNYKEPNQVEWETSGVNKRKLSFHKNTAKNRRKYLK